MQLTTKLANYKSARMKAAGIINTVITAFIKVPDTALPINYSKWGQIHKLRRAKESLIKISPNGKVAICKYKK